MEGRGRRPPFVLNASCMRRGMTRQSAQLCAGTSGSPFATVLVWENPMHRRKFLTILGAAAVGGAPPASAQTPSRVYRLGTISPGQPVPATSPSGKVLVGALAQHGFT